MLKHDGYFRIIKDGAYLAKHGLHAMRMLTMTDVINHVIKSGTKVKAVAIVTCCVAKITTTCSQ